MRILLLAQIVPYPPDSGPKVKTYGSLRALAKAHEVTVLAFSRSAADESRAQELAAACGCRVHTVALRRGRARDLLAAGYALLTGQSFILARDRRRAMHRMVRILLAQEPFDAIHVDQLNMAQYVPRRFDGQVIFDAHNAVWMITDRMAEHETHVLRARALRAEARRIQRAEGQICRRADAVLTVTPEDRAALLLASGRLFTGAVIPIGVEIPAEPPNRGRTPLILHVGTMFYPPNADAVRWFATEVFDRVRAAVPAARFVIVGARPPADILALNDPARGIDVEDIRPLLEEAMVTVVPTRAGSGMRVKILEAMAQGLPVVTTTVGAEGIAVEPGTHLLIGDDPETFANATIHVLTDAGMRQHLREHARALAAERYDWDVTGAMVCALYAQLEHAPSPASAMMPELAPQAVLQD